MNTAEYCGRFFFINLSTLIVKAIESAENVAEDCGRFQHKFSQGKCGCSFAEDFIGGFHLENVAEDYGRFQLKFH